MLRLLLVVFSLLWGLVLLLVGGRFLLLLLGANQDAELVAWVLSRSNFWVEPFFDVFNFTNRAVEDVGGVFEPASLVALIVYAAVGSLVSWLIATPLGGWYGRHRHTIGV